MEYILLAYISSSPSYLLRVYDWLTISIFEPVMNNDSSFAFTLDMHNFGTLKV